MDPLTTDEFKAALPERMRKTVNQGLIDSVNAIVKEPELYESFRENLISYGHVLADGKYKMTSYLYAVMYVSHKLMGKTNTDAYSLTFPDKISRFASEGVASKDIASYICAYNKSKLVSAIMEQSLVPTWVLNQDLFQDALNKQAYLMRTANSEMVQHLAAKALLETLKQPETTKVQLDIGVSEDSSLTMLRETTLKLVAQNKLAIESGSLTAQDIAQSSLVVKDVN